MKSNWFMVLSGFTFLFLIFRTNFIRYLISWAKPCFLPRFVSVFFLEEFIGHSFNRSQSFFFSAARKKTTFSIHLIDFLQKSFTSDLCWGKKGYLCLGTCFGNVIYKRCTRMNEMNLINRKCLVFCYQTNQSLLMI